MPGSSELNSPTSRIIPRSDKFGTNIETKFTGTNDKGEVGEISGISLEPVTFLNQKKRYLEHLNSLRRLNEGDDVGDSPGYALNLLRIPVSVLPGRETRKGYGAEIAITVDPYESEELLPEVFRNFVVNGVVDRISPTVMRLVTEMSNDNSYEKTSLFWTLYRYSIIASDTTDNDTMKAILDDIKKISNELLKTESDIEIKSQLNKVNSVIDAHQNPDALFKEIRGLLLNLAVIRISLEDRHPSSELYKQNIVEADQTFEKLDLILEPIKEIYEWKTPEYGNDLLNKNELSELTFLLEKGSRVSLDQTEFIRLKQLQLKRFPSSLISRHTTNENVVLEINEEEIVSSFSKGYSKKNPFEQPPSKIFSEKFQWLLTRLLNDIFQSYRQGAYEFLPTGNGSQLKQAVTLSHNNFVDGTSLIPVSLLAYQVLRPDVHQVNYEDVRRFLRQEIAGSYEMLSQEFVEHGEISNITETSKSRKDIEGVTPSQPVVDILTGSSMQVRMTRSKKKKKPPTEKSETIVFETYRHHIDMMEF